MIGTRPAPRTRLMTSRPSISGRPRSSSTRSGFTLLNCAQPASPVAASSTSIAFGAEAGLEQAADRRLVIDDEDTDRMRGHAASARCGGTGSSMMKSPPLRSARLRARIVPPIAVDEAAADGEAEAGARPLAVGFLHAVEFVEDALDLVLRNAAAFIEHMQLDRAVAAARAELDRSIAPARISPRCRAG